MSRRLLKDVAPTQLLIYSSNNFLPHKKNINKYIYINIYILFSHQEGDERCMFISHQRNNISFNLLSLRVPVHTNVLLHRPLRRAVDVNDLKFFNIEFFEQRLSFITRTIISRVSWVMSKENLSLVNSKLQPRGYIKKYFNWGILYGVQAGKVTKQEQS